MLEADRAWLDGFRRGTKDALTRVLDSYLDDVARTIRMGVMVMVDGRPVRLGANLAEPDVEALVQETFARAFAPKARLAYDGVRPYGAYLATIARNLVVDVGRAQVREARVDMDVGLLEASTPDPARVAEERELSRLVGEFQAGLTEPDKTVFRLRLVEEKTYTDTGSAAGLTEMQVRRRAVKMQQALLDFLRGHGFLRDTGRAIRSSLAPRRRTE